MSDLRGRRVLVTGASGFVGAHLCRALTAAGARVHGLGSEPPRDDLPLEAWWDADLLDPPSIERAVGGLGPAAIVHLAGQSSAGRSFDSPVETFRANAVGTWHVLESVRRLAPGARVLAVGSGEVYGSQPEGGRVREDAPFRPVSPYALSKAVADAYAAAAAELHGLDVVRTRSFAHAGPGQDARFALPSWARQIADAEHGVAEPVLRVGPLEITRDLTDVRDVVDAYRALLERGRRGVAYNVCRGEGVTLAEVLRRMVGLSRVPLRVESDPSRRRPADVVHLVGDPSAIREATGWEARIPLDRTLEDLLADARGGR